MESLNWQKLEEIVRSLLEGHNAFFVGHAVRRERGHRVFEIYVDTDEGITISQCAEISRELGAALDAQAVVNEPYELEVSSPGIEKPLKLLRQYKKNIGRKYKVDYWQENDRKTFKGTLIGIDGERLTFSDEQQSPVTLEFSKIIESIEELPW